MVDEEEAFKELISSTIAGIASALKDTNLAILAPIELELSVVTKKVGAGKVKLVLVEAGGKYEKEEISRIKLYIGSRHGGLYKKLGGWAP